MAYIAMACIVMTCIVMAYVAMACIVMAYMAMACIVPMAFMVMAEARVAEVGICLQSHPLVG